MTNSGFLRLATFWSSFNRGVASLGFKKLKGPAMTPNWFLEAKVLSFQKEKALIILWKENFASFWSI